MYVTTPGGPSDTDQLGIVERKRRVTERTGLHQLDAPPAALRNGEMHVPR